MRRFSILFIATLGLLALNNFAQAQRDDINPCKIEKVTIDKTAPGRSADVTILRRECDQVLISLDRYVSLVEYADSLRSLTNRYMASVKANITLRDSIDDLRAGYIQKQDTTIAQYQGLNAQYQKLAADYNTALDK